MKKLFSILFLLGNVFMLIMAEKTVAVSTFDVVGNAVSKDEAEIMTELYIAELVTAGWVVVPNRAKFSKVLNELKFQATDWSDASKTTKLGNAMNADVLSTGKIMKLKSKLYIIATLIDAKTAGVLSSSKMEAKSVGDIPDILVNFVSSLTSRDASKVVEEGRGPGGGIALLAGDRWFEVSGILGTAESMDDARKMCKEYRGGGYSDWRLPLPDELWMLYLDFHYSAVYYGTTIRDRNTYWTTLPVPESCSCWVIDFSKGETNSTSEYDERVFSVRAVRAF